jgi:hypothetical protein
MSFIAWVIYPTEVINDQVITTSRHDPLIIFMAADGGRLDIPGRSLMQCDIVGERLWSD